MNESFHKIQPICFAKFVFPKLSNVRSRKPGNHPCSILLRMVTFGKTCGYKLEKSAPEWCPRSDRSQSKQIHFTFQGQV